MRKSDEAYLRHIIINEINGKFNPKDKYNKVELVNDKNIPSGKDWAKSMGNFPVKRNGKIFWVNRSVTCSLFAYCKNSDGEWCVLVNQRGSGAQNEHGKWNCPIGYCNANEDFKSAAIREAWEECGVKIPRGKVIHIGTNSSGDRNFISARFAAILDGVTDDYPLSDANCEPGEVSDIAWMPITKVGNYSWAWGCGKKIIDQAKTLGILDDGMRQTDGYDNMNGLIARLKQEIGDNDKALFYLDMLLKRM